MQYLGNEFDWSSWSVKYFCDKKKIYQIQLIVTNVEVRNYQHYVSQLLRCFKFENCAINLLKGHYQFAFLPLRYFYFLGIIKRTGLLFLPQNQQEHQKVQVTGTNQTWDVDRKFKQRVTLKVCYVETNNFQVCYLICSDHSLYITLFHTTDP